MLAWRRSGSRFDRTSNREGVTLVRGLPRELAALATAAQSSEKTMFAESFILKRDAMRLNVS